MILRLRPFRQLGPWWLVAAAVGTGLVLLALKDIRLGGQVMAAGFAGGAVIRAVTSRKMAGGIAARHRAVDVVILLGLAAGVLVASATVNLNP